MTHKEINELVKEYIEIVNLSLCMNDEINPDHIVEIKMNPRLTRSLGRCKHRYGLFTLEFSVDYFNYENTTQDDRESIIVHEILHTVQGCQNHGEKFNRLGRLMERETGLKDIAGSTKSDTRGYSNARKKATYKYRLTCNGCGNTWLRKRSKGLRISNYTCKCGSGISESLI